MIRTDESPILVGENARKAGRYDMAVRAFQSVGGNIGASAKAARLEFTALREVDISRYLIDHYRRRMGFDGAFYQGFAAIKPLESSTVARRLDELADKFRVIELVNIPPWLGFFAVNVGTGSSRGSLLSIAKTQLIRLLLTLARLTAIMHHTAEGAPWSQRMADRVARSGMLPEALSDLMSIELRVAMARHLLRRGRARDALTHLEHPAAGNLPSVQREALRGMALWQLGDATSALWACNLSLLYMSGPTAADGTQLSIRYRNHRITYYKGEFYALPETFDVLLTVVGQRVNRLDPYIPRRLRTLLRRAVPYAWAKFARRMLVHLVILSHGFARPSLHSSNLIALMDTVALQGAQSDRQDA